MMYLKMMYCKLLVVRPRHLFGISRHLKLSLIVWYKVFIQNVVRVKLKSILMRLFGLDNMIKKRNLLQSCGHTLTDVMH